MSEVQKMSAWALIGDDPQMRDMNYLTSHLLDSYWAQSVGEPLPPFNPPPGYWERCLQTAIWYASPRARYGRWRHEAGHRIGLAWDALRGRHDCE